MAESTTPKKTETKSKPSVSDSSSSSTPTSTTEGASSSSSSTGTAEGSSSSSSSTSAGDKSSRESVGGAGAVHYGFFSNIKSPEYKSGWDDIWGNEKPSGKNSTGKKAPQKKAAARKTASIKEPVLVNLSLSDLPAAIQEELVSVARTKLKKSRLSYDSREKKGAVSWRIECEVKR